MGNAATVQAIYEAFGKGDLATILGHLADDVQWEPWDDNRAVAAGIAFLQPHDKAGVPEFFASLADWKFARLEAVDYLESAHQVAAEMEIDATLDNGAHITDQQIHLWSFNDAGQVTRFRHYLDTAKYVAAYEGAAV